MLIDLLHRRAAGLFTELTVEDCSFWEHTAIPILLGIISPVVGVTPIHAASLRHFNGNLLISGESGSGKSTLAFALANIGLDLIADDWTYVSSISGQLRMWSPSVPIKLLPDVTRFFPDINFPEPRKCMNGEKAIELNFQDPNVKVSGPSEVPKWIVFLERAPQPDFEMHPVSSDWAAHELSRSLEQLPDCFSLERDAQLETIQKLSKSECWYLRSAGHPMEIAKKVDRFCSSRSRNRPPLTCNVKPPHGWPDLLRRRSPALFGHCINVDEKEIWLESDHPGVLQLDKDTFRDLKGGWKLTFLAEDSLPEADHATAELRCGSLLFTVFGESGFVALDKETEFGFCCLSTDFLSHPHGRETLSMSISNLLEEAIHEPQAS